ncbi:MAG: metallophosphoesterase family protein [Actinomycetota bacterium]
MRIGIVSDIHANALGLSVALERMGDVDLLLCAGDMVEEFRFSGDALQLLRDHQAVCVLGNHDIGLLSPHGERARSGEHVDPELVKWLAAQPKTIELDVDGKRLLMTHASPIEPHTQYVFPHSPELKKMRTIEADYIILGHTHAQMSHRAGRALVINPGSVGQARDHTNGKQLSYAVLDTTTDDVVFDNYLTS